MCGSKSQSSRRWYDVWRECFGRSIDCFIPKRRAYNHVACQLTIAYAQLLCLYFAKIGNTMIKVQISEMWHTHANTNRKLETKQRGDHCYYKASYYFVFVYCIILFRTLLGVCLFFKWCCLYCYSGLGDSNDIKPCSKETKVCNIWRYLCRILTDLQTVKELNSQQSLQCFFSKYCSYVASLPYLVTCIHTKSIIYLCNV